jgi:DNA (cytosine-5)-methyltransferase 1
MAAYYNEIDPYAAEWLRNLIKAGLIAPGEVDQRSIEDVLPTDLLGFTQCHFFAGIGVWSAALRGAGWPDDRPVWTGSCPCQPFSTAGKGAGVADERHLWPAWFHLIQHGKRPGVPVFGEQVANGDGLTWLDLVQADMEGAGYAFRAVDLCAAGFGAPHIRQRLFFHAQRLADAHVSGQPGSGELGRPGDSDEVSNRQVNRVVDDGGSLRLADPGHGEHQRRDAIRQADGGDDSPARAGEGAGAERERPVDDAAVRGPGCWMADATGKRKCPDQLGRDSEEGKLVVGAGPWCNGSDDGATERLADAHGEGRGGRRVQGQGQGNGPSDGATLERPAGLCADGRPGPVNGLWGASDWLWCRDNKWRPVEPGTFPLVDGTPARVGRLRAYGNAINKEVAEGFIKAIMIG